MAFAKREKLDWTAVDMDSFTKKFHSNMAERAKLIARMTEIETECSNEFKTKLVSNGIVKADDADRVVCAYRHGPSWAIKPEGSAASTSKKMLLK